MKAKRTTGGFTLIEVMISIAILGVIMTLIWATTAQTLRAKDEVESRDMIFHEGSLALRKISDDLISAFLVKAAALTPGSATAQQAVGAGTFTTFFIGEDKSGQDSLGFTTLTHLRLFKNSKESDQCKVYYEVGEVGEDERTLALFRREDPYIDDSTEVKGRALMLVDNVKVFKVEYFDARKNEWVKSWNSETVDYKDRLPAAVRITLAFADPTDPELEITMSTSVIPALARAPIEM